MKMMCQVHKCFKVMFISISNTYYVVLKQKSLTERRRDGGREIEVGERSGEGGEREREREKEKRKGKHILNPYRLYHITSHLTSFPQIIPDPS